MKEKINKKDKSHPKPWVLNQRITREESEVRDKHLSRLMEKAFKDKGMVLEFETEKEAKQIYFCFMTLKAKIAKNKLTRYEEFLRWDSLRFNRPDEKTLWIRPRIIGYSNTTNTILHLSGQLLEVPKETKLDALLNDFKNNV